MRIYNAFSLKVNTNVRMFAQKSYCKDPWAVYFFFFFLNFFVGIKRTFLVEFSKSPKKFLVFDKLLLIFLPPVLGFNLGTYGHSYYLVKKKTFTMSTDRPGINQVPSFINFMCLRFFFVNIVNSAIQQHINSISFKKPTSIRKVTHIFIPETFQSSIFFSYDNFQHREREESKIHILL